MKKEFRKDLTKSDNDALDSIKLMDVGRDVKDVLIQMLFIKNKNDLNTIANWIAERMNKV